MTRSASHRVNASSVSHQTFAVSPRPDDDERRIVHEVAATLPPFVVASVAPRRAQLGQPLARLPNRHHRADPLHDERQFLLGPTVAVVCEEPRQPRPTAGRAQEQLIVDG
jgi:hypothetical protein